MLYLRSVIFLSINSSTLFTGESNSGLSSIVKNKASKNHCINPPPRHQTRKTEINIVKQLLVSRPILYNNVMYPCTYVGT